MTTSLIINTACGDMNARHLMNPVRSTSYADRAPMLERIVRESEGRFDQIVVAGVLPEALEELPYSVYINVNAAYGDRRDALIQREVGARASTGDLLIFTHDDHLPDFDAADIPLEPAWDILVPQRVHGLTGAVLNNGMEDGYMGGHTLCMWRHVWVRFPWVSMVPERCWDLPMTALWVSNDISIAFTDDIISVDLEAQVNEL